MSPLYADKGRVMFEILKIKEYKKCKRKILKERKKVGVNKMLGLLINDKEQTELAYVIRRELEELLLDLDDQRIDTMVKETMRHRYKLLFQLFQRVGSDEEVRKYIPRRVKIDEGF